MLCLLSLTLDTFGISIRTCAPNSAREEHNTMTAQEPVAVTTGLADINGTQLYYEVAGAGHPLVLIHAGITDHRLWDDQFVDFARSYRTIRYDLRGFGQSPMPAAPYSMRDDLRALMDHLGVSRAHIVGLSIGGGIALDFALDYPDCVSALVLVASGVSGTTPSEELQRQIAAIDAAEASEGVTAAVELELRLWVDGLRRSPDAVNPTVRERVREMNTAVFASPQPGTSQRLQPPATERLHEIQVPTLVIYGDGDISDVIASAALLTGGIVGARQVVIPGTAHVPNMEEPEIFNRIVQDFLTTIA